MFLSILSCDRSCCNEDDLSRCRWYGRHNPQTQITSLAKLLKLWVHLHIVYFTPVLRIHDILVWIRIRIWIRGSMPLTNGSGCGSGSCYFFVIILSDANKKQYFLNKFFCLLLFEGTFASFFKDKKSKRSHKAVGIKVFLTIFAWWQKDPDPGLDPDQNPYPWLMNPDPDPDPGGPKTYGSDGSRFGSGSATLLCSILAHLPPSPRPHPDFLSKKNVS